MKTKLLIISIYLFVSSIYGDVGSGPYPPSGWKPSGARLEYGAPFIRLNGQINQLVRTTTYPPTTTTYDYDTTTLDRGYLPPTTTEYPEDEPVDPLRVQQLPKENLRKQNAAKIEDFRSQFFASQYPLQFGVQPSSSSAFGRIQSPQNVVPQNTNEYLPPRSGVTNNQREVENIVQKNYSNSAEKQDESDDGGASGDDQNSENDFVPAQNGAQFQGQYYILAPDNTLQRVIYQTIQTEEDVQNQGFRAQLKYSPVEPVKPPVYGYNDEGQLIRIYRKK